MWNAIGVLNEGQREMTPASDPTSCLVEAVENLWSGKIDVYDQRGTVGEVIIHSGRIAWARSKRQRENLIELLWRLGRISRGQLSHVQQLYQDGGGKRRLDLILEEAGYMSRPVLRRCLLLHTRNAIDSILSLEGVQVEMKAANGVRAEELILFDPGEVLPEELLARVELPDELDDGSEWVRNWFTLNRDNVILGDLAGLKGYQASAVLSFDGDVVTAHSATETIDIGGLCVYMAAVMEAGARGAQAAQRRTSRSVTVGCDGGWICGGWLDDNRYYQVLVVIDHSGIPAEVARAIEQAAPGLYAWLMPAHAPA